MLIDAFIFHNETDMLEFRLKTLEPYVDLFVIVESDHTFSGNPKPYYTESMKLARWKDKIVFHKIKSDVSKLDLSVKPENYNPESDFWKIEYEQRNAIKDAVDCYSDEDFILIGDVDEIPSREALKMMTENKFSGVATFQMFFFYYNLHTLREEMWPGTIWCPLKALRKFGAQELRNARGQTGFNIERGGWHLSYFGGVESIKNKINSFSHQEYNNETFNTEQSIKNHIQNGTDLFERNIPSMKPPEDFFPDYFSPIKEWL